MLQPIPGNYNSVYSGVMMSMSNSVSIQPPMMELTHKEEQIRDLVKAIHTKEGVEKIKAFYLKEAETVLSEEENTLLQEPDFHFLQTVLKIRKQILSLKLKYQELTEKNDAIYAEIGKLNTLLQNLMDQTEQYNRFVLMFQLETPSSSSSSSSETYNIRVNEVVDKQIDQIRIIVNKQEEKARENETQMSEILHVVQLLKQMVTISTEEMSVLKEPESESDPELATKAVCVICTNRSVKYCLSGCGHCFCEPCSDKIKTSCHVCRASVSTKIRLFYD